MKLVLFLLFVLVLSGEPKQYQGRGLVDRKLVQAPPVILLLAVPRRLFCFGGDFRCDVPLFIVILGLYLNIQIGKIDVK